MKAICSCILLVLVVAAAVVRATYEPTLHPEYTQSAAHASVFYWAHPSDKWDGSVVILLRLADETPVTAVGRGGGAAPVPWVQAEHLPSAWRPPAQRDATFQVLRVTPDVELHMVIMPDGQVLARALTGDATRVRYQDIPQPLVLRFVPRDSDTDSQRNYTTAAHSLLFAVDGVWMSRTANLPLDAPPGGISGHVVGETKLLVLGARFFHLVADAAGTHWDGRHIQASADIPFGADLKGRLPMRMPDGLYHAVDVYVRWWMHLDIVAPPGLSFANTTGALIGWESPVAIVLLPS